MKASGELKKVQSYFNRGDWPQVIKLGENLLSAGEDEHLLLACLAVAYNSTKQQAKAQRACEDLYRTYARGDVVTESMQIGSSTMRYHLVLAGIYFKQQRYDEALEICQRLKALGNKLSDKFVYAGRIHLAQGQFSRAADEFSHLIKHRPDRADASLRYLDEVLEADPGNPVVHRSLFEVYERKNLTRRRIQQSEAALAKDPGDLLAVFSLGHLYRFSGNFEPAIDLWQKYAASHPTCKQLHLALGSTYLDQGKLEEAARAWEAFDAASPAEVDAVFDCYHEMLRANWCSEAVVRRMVELGLRFEREDAAEEALKIIRPLLPDSTIVADILEKVFLYQANRYSAEDNTVAVLARLRDLTQLRPGEASYQGQVDEFIATHPELQPHRYEAAAPPAAPGVTPAEAAAETSNFKQWAGAAKANLALVFTDVVGSTALGNEIGNQGMRDVRREHFKRGREVVAMYDGYEIKTIGDSLMVAFHTAVEALQFSLALHADTGHDRVHIRAGIHVGIVDVEEDDVFGAVVNYTARVESEAKGAEIWLSNRAKADIDDEGAADFKQLTWPPPPRPRVKRIRRHPHPVVRGAGVGG